MVLVPHELDNGVFRFPPAPSAGIAELLDAYGSNNWYSAPRISIVAAAPRRALPDGKPGTSARIEMHRFGAIFGNFVTERASKITAGDSSAAARQAAAREPIAFDDLALVRQFRKGDMEAFSLLVAKYQDRIYNMLLRMVSRPADAEELAQEAFLRAMERIGQFGGRSKFYTWLFRIATNLAISRQRRRGRIKFHSLDGPEEYDGRAPRALGAALATRREVGPLTAAVAKETNARVAAALDELDEEFRLVVVLRDIEEMDYAQVAEVMDVPVGTVKSRLHRARGMLRDRLKDLLGDDD